MLFSSVSSLFDSSLLHTYSHVFSRIKRSPRDTAKARTGCYVLKSRAPGPESIKWEAQNSPKSGNASPQNATQGWQETLFGEKGQNFHFLARTKILMLRSPRSLKKASVYQSTEYGYG